MEFESSRRCSIHIGIEEVESPVDSILAILGEEGENAKLSLMSMIKKMKLKNLPLSKRKK